MMNEQLNNKFTREEEDERIRMEEEQEERRDRRVNYYGGDDNKPIKPRRQIFIFSERDVDNDDVISMVESTPTVDRKKDELKRIQDKAEADEAPDDTGIETGESDTPAFTITF